MTSEHLGAAGGLKVLKFDVLFMTVGCDMPPPQMVQFGHFFFWMSFFWVLQLLYIISNFFLKVTSHSFVHALLGGRFLVLVFQHFLQKKISLQLQRNRIILPSSRHLRRALEIKPQVASDGSTVGGFVVLPTWLIRGHES